MNYADLNVKYTRIHEPRHFHPERDYKKNKTVIIYEQSDNDPDEPFYPIRTKENEKILGKYKQLSKKDERVIINGRLGDYKYYDMDKTIYAALDCYETKIKR
jgi:UDP-galactopyranose mutase